MKRNVISPFLVLVVGLAMGHAAFAGDFGNGDFETGSAGVAPPIPWVVSTFTNQSGFAAYPPHTVADLNLNAGGTSKTVILSAPAGPMSQSDPNVSSLHWPRFGNQCAIVNQSGNNKNVNELSQTVALTSSSLDSADGQYHVRFVIAPVLQNGGHTTSLQPYCFLQVLNLTHQTVLYSDVLVFSRSELPWKTISPGTANEIDYMDWQLIDVTGDSAVLGNGNTVKLQVFGGGCQPGGHWGQLYIDQAGLTIPGIYVIGRGVQFPSNDGMHTNVTYTLTYKNGNVNAQSGVQVNFVIPANTTFLSANAPGLSLVTPAVGAAGTVTATVGTLAAGASGSFTVTVQAATGATGPFVAYNYSIYSAQSVDPLIGPTITPLILATPLSISRVSIGNGTFTLNFSNTHGLSFTTLRTTDLTLPLSGWEMIGHPTEISPGNFEFTDTTATPPRYFYRVSSP